MERKVIVNQEEEKDPIDVVGSSNGITSSPLQHSPAPISGNSGNVEKGTFHRENLFSVIFFKKILLYSNSKFEQNFVIS